VAPLYKQPGDHTAASVSSFLGTGDIVDKKIIAFDSFSRVHNLSRQL